VFLHLDLVHGRSLASYTIGAHIIVSPQEQDDAPMPPSVPADETNL
jgi:hypothetical protein